LLATKHGTETKEQKQNTQVEDQFSSLEHSIKLLLLPPLLLHAAKDAHMLVPAAVDPSSAKDAAAQTRHIGRADGLEQEILCPLLQAPGREHHAGQEAENKMQKRCE
jgi:hypothetical protein